MILDAGGLLFADTTLHPSKAEQSKITARGISKAYQVMGYDAVGVSARDLAAGLDFLTDTGKEDGLTWLSANLIESGNGKTVFPATLSKNLDGLKVGITALTDPLPTGRAKNRNLEVVPWQKALPRVIPELGGDNDMIILLTALDTESCREIAESFPSINLIIQASHQSANTPPEKLSDTTILTATAKRGKQIGIMEISWHRDGKWGSGSKKILLSKKSALDRINWQINRFKDREGMAERVKHLLEKRATLSSEIKELTKAASQAETSFYSNNFIPMAANLPDDPEILALVETIRKKANLAGRNQKDQTGLRSALRSKGLMGWPACTDCHAAQVKAWSQTPHARAYKTLVNEGQQFNRNCISCHVTGAITGQESYALSLPSNLRSVGCEVCHGPGRKHQEAPRKNGMSKASEATCLRCHISEHDGSFDFEQDRLKVHPTS